MNGAVLYDWPAAAKFGRVVPKTKLYEHGGISSRVRAQLTSDVARITWAYKLADETIHLRGTGAVPEIQVFAVQLKGEEVRDDVLSAIDRSIPFPIIFEISRGEDDTATVRISAAHKQLGAGFPRISGYFRTSWMPHDAPRRPLPPAIDLSGLYAQLMASLLPVSLRPGEDVAGAASRLEQAKKIEREVAGLRRRIKRETQLNRRVELRREIKTRAEALSALTDTETS